MALWLDVTTILGWKRPAVGVVRVEAECFRHLAALRLPDVRFCHVIEGDEYREISADEVTATITRQHVAPARDAAPPAEARRTAKRVTMRAEAMLNRLAPAIREPVLEVAQRSAPVLRTALHHYRRASSTVGQLSGQLDELKRAIQTARKPPSTRPPPFSRGDVLISAGLDWDRKDLAVLFRLKLDLELKVILFCYDLIPVLFPHLCVGEVAGAFARYFVDVAWCADEVLCISQSSQRDFLALVREAGAPEPTTSVVRLGSNLPATHPIDAPLIKEEFLLFVSTIERRKNHEVLYRAALHLLERGRTELPLFVFVGMMGWGVNDFINDLQLDPRVKGRFVLLNHVSDAELSDLYRRARFTLYPSHYEGWGLPLAESLAHGKFALASNTSSLPEVGGDLVEYVDPWDSRRWAERIAHYLDHPDEVATREAAIRARYQAPTWADTARQIAERARRYQR